jgi:hypothetical protein
MKFNDIVSKLLNEEEQLSRLDRINLLKSRALDEPVFRFAVVQWEENKRLPVDKLMEFVNNSDLPYVESSIMSLREPHAPQTDKSLDYLIRKYKPSINQESSYCHRMYYSSIRINDTQILDAIYLNPEVFGNHILQDKKTGVLIVFTDLKTLTDIAEEHRLLAPF